MLRLLGQTSYGVTFAACLPFWGRTSDLLSASPVFNYGFLCFGLSNLAVSFMPEQYSFFIFRAFTGVFAAATVSSGPSQHALSG